MPRRNNRRRSRRWADDLTDAPPLSFEDMAQTLVLRGIRGPSILDDPPRFHRMIRSRKDHTR